MAAALGSARKACACVCVCACVCLCTYDIILYPYRHVLAVDEKVLFVHTCVHMCWPYCHFFLFLMEE